jgi:hypothetical protein
MHPKPQFVEMVPRFRWLGAKSSRGRKLRGAHEPKEAQTDHGNLKLSVGIIVVIAALVFWGVVGSR